MEDYIQSFFPQVWETGEGFKANCPACGDRERKFAWNIEKKVGCCFHSSCRWFVGHGGVTEYRIRSWFARNGFEHAVPETIHYEEDAEVQLPQEFELLEECRDSTSLYAYLRSRGIPQRLADKAKVGYCSEGKFWGYIIFPVFDEDGDVVWWQGRRFKEREPKFWNPKCSKKSELVYCVSAARRPKTIVLVESIINALTLENDVGRITGGVMTMALLGKSLSDAQREHVLQYERYLKTLVIALDGDARRDTVAIADKFLGIIPDIRIANIPNGEDINSLGREKAWSLVRKAEGYNAKNRIEFMTREV